MNLPLPPSSSWPAPRPRWARLLVNFAVAVVVIAVAGATFVFSYSGVHAVALLGGVSPKLARYYPAVFDALLVVACTAAVVLRDGRWWARLWAWLVVVVVLAAIGWVDVIHAINYGLEHRPTEGAVAAAPVVAVLLAFSLLLTMLRQSRPRPTGPGGPRSRRARRDDEDGPATENLPTILLPAVQAPVVSAPPPYPVPPYPVPPYPAPPAPVPAPVAALPPAAVAATCADPVPATRADPVLATRAELVPSGAPVEAEIPSAETRPIRYAGRSAREEPASGYWDGENDPELAGQVYPPRNADPEEPSDSDGPYEPDGQQPAESTETDADGSRFETIPRLNRARVTPTPPRDDQD